MPSTELHINPVMKAITIDDEKLTIEFKTGKKREYIDVPKEISYGLFYSKTPVKFFNDNIKKKYKVFKV